MSGFSFRICDDNGNLFYNSNMKIARIFQSGIVNKSKNVVSLDYAKLKYVYDDEDRFIPTDETTGKYMFIAWYDSWFHNETDIATTIRGTIEQGEDNNNYITFDNILIDFSAFDETTKFFAGTVENADGCDMEKCRFKRLVLDFDDVNNFSFLDEESGSADFVASQASFLLPEGANDTMHAFVRTMKGPRWLLAFPLDLSDNIGSSMVMFHQKTHVGSIRYMVVEVE